MQQNLNLEQIFFTDNFMVFYFLSSYSNVIGICVHGSWFMLSTSSWIFNVTGKSDLLCINMLNATVVRQEWPLMRMVLQYIQE